MAREYLVWREDGTLISGPHRKREVAERREREARVDCAASGCGNGDPESSNDPSGTTCGVLNPHGISIQTTEDGRDITGYDF